MTRRWWLRRWYFTEMDIRSTLASVCFKLLHDHSVSNKVLAKRAKALKILGEAFIAKGGSMAAGLGDIKAKMASKMGGEGAGAAGQEGNAGEKGETAPEHTAPASATTTAAAASATPQTAPKPSDGGRSPAPTDESTLD
jgi:hypothetical protein